MYSTEAPPHEGLGSLPRGPLYLSLRGSAYLFCFTVMPFCFKAFSLAICRS